MGFFDKIKQTVSGVQSKLPEDLNSPEELKARAQALVGQHSDAVNSAVDNLQGRVGNEGLNGKIDNIQAKVTDFGKTEK